MKRNSTFSGTGSGHSTRESLRHSSASHLSTHSNTESISSIETVIEQDEARINVIIIAMEKQFMKEGGILSLFGMFQNQSEEYLKFKKELEDLRTQFTHLRREIDVLFHKLKDTQAELSIKTNRLDNHDGNAEILAEAYLKNIKKTRKSSSWFGARTDNENFTPEEVKDILKQIIQMRRPES